MSRNTFAVVVVIGTILVFLCGMWFEAAKSSVPHTSCTHPAAAIGQFITRHDGTFDWGATRYASEAYICTPAGWQKV